MTIENDFTAILKGRVSTYGLLSRLFRVEVDQELYDALRTMKFPADTGEENVDVGYAMICDYLGEPHQDVLTELAIDYVRAFIGSGNDGYSAAYPYESVYTSPKRLMMQDARDEVLVLYHAAGIEKKDSWKEGEDHIALELEFEKILAQRALDAFDEGDEERCYTLLLQQRNFLEDHLLSWYPMMAEDMKKFPRTKFYQGLGFLTSGYLQSDFDFLNDVLGEEESQETSVDTQDDKAACVDTDCAEGGE